MVPSLGLEWAESDGRSGTRLKYPKIIGPVGHYRTLQRASIHWEGVRIYNSLPDIIKNFMGSKESMKDMLDRYLDLIPDQPECQGMIPGGRTLYGRPSNSIADWTRVIDVKFSTSDCDDKIR